MVYVRWLIIVNIIALVFLGASFFLALKLKKLMGTGKDTAPVKILMVIITLNGLLGVVLLAGGWFEYVQDYIYSIRITDIIIMIIGIVSAISIWKIYSDYKKLIKKHEPSS